MRSKEFMDLIIKGDKQIKRQQDDGSRDNEEDPFVIGVRANHFFSRISRGRSRLESVGSPLFLSPIAMLGEKKGRDRRGSGTLEDGEEIRKESNQNQKQREGRDYDYRQPRSEVIETAVDMTAHELLVINQTQNGKQDNR